jgi:uncharacterized protein (TIGR02270 family)
VAGEAGIATAWSRLGQDGGPGELFVVTTLSLESGNSAKIERLLQSAESVPELRRGFIGGLGWVSPEILRGLVVRWLESPSPFRRFVGVTACSLHRADPGSRLEALLRDETRVRARALRLAGELGRVDLQQRVSHALDDEEEVCRFWAAWSAGMLGARRSAITVLRPHALSHSSSRRIALDLALRLMERESAIDWIRELGQDPKKARLVVVAAGILGDPLVVPWLIGKMNSPAVARVAGESFSAITGIGLSEAGLDRQAPDEFSAGKVDQAEDENLPWPDPIKIEAQWQMERARFTPSVRHLNGLPITAENCQRVLRDGNQRHRRAAAYELALMNPGRLWNWRAKAHAQTMWRSAPTSTSL